MGGVSRISFIHGVCVQNDVDLRDLQILWRGLFEVRCDAECCRLVSVESFPSLLMQPAARSPLIGQMKNDKALLLPRVSPFRGQMLLEPFGPQQTCWSDSNRAANYSVPPVAAHSLCVLLLPVTFRGHLFIYLFRRGRGHVLPLLAHPVYPRVMNSACQYGQQGALCTPQVVDYFLLSSPLHFDSMFVCPHFGLKVSSFDTQVAERGWKSKYELWSELKLVSIEGWRLTPSSLDRVIYHHHIFSHCWK